MNEAPNLSGCVNLRKLRRVVYPTDLAEIALISTITSKHIQKITFAESVALRSCHHSHEYWTGLDNTLSELGPQTDSMLHVEVQTSRKIVPNKFEMYLPRFQEVGRVTFADANGNVVYSWRGAERHDQPTEERKQYRDQ